MNESIEKRACDKYREWLRVARYADDNEELDAALSVLYTLNYIFGNDMFDKVKII